MRSAVFIMLSLAISQATGAESWPPPSGTNVDQKRTFTLPTQAPEPCLSAARDGVSFLLPVDELKRMADADRSAGNGATDGRVAVDAGRATYLLSLATTKKDQYGCALLAMPLGSDPAYAVLRLLEAGKAAVAVDGKLSPQVIVEYAGMRCGDLCGRGDILVFLPDGHRLILSLLWWVS